MTDTTITEPIVITIPDDSATTTVTVETPLAQVQQPPEPAAAEPPAPPPVSDAPEDGVATLKQQLASREAELASERESRMRAETGRAEMERIARESAGRAEQFRSQASDASYDSIVNAFGAAQREQEALQGQLVDAHEKGDYPRIAKIQADMGKTAARIERLETDKARAEQIRAAPPVQQMRPQTQQAPESPEQFFNRPWNDSEFNAYISSRSPRTAAWVRQNPQFANDVGFRQAVAGAHEYVTKTLKVPTDTDQYFTRVQEAIGMRNGTSQPAQQPTGDPVSQASQVQRQPAAPQPQQRAAVPAAPPSRSVPSSRGSETQITLTPEERMIARQIMPPKIKDTDPDPEVAYARQKAQLIREGRLGTGH